MAELGIILARHSGEISISKNKKILVLLLTVAMVFVCSHTRFTFTLSGVFLVLFLLYFRNNLSHIRLLLFLGRISAALYVIHPVVHLGVVHYTRQLGSDIHSAVPALVVLAVSIALAVPYTRLLAKR